MEAKVSPSLLILILLPILSVRGGATSSSLDVSLSELFKNLQGSKKGDKVEGIHKVKQYLERYGYLNTTNRHIDDDANNFDDALECSVKSFQSYYHLSPTGILDTSTIKEMSKSRCGVPDIVEGSSGGGFGSSHYDFFPGRPVWPLGWRHLKYFYDTSMYPEAAVDAIANAFSSWAHVSPFTFESTSNVEDANIKVSFEIGDHGDGRPFIGSDSQDLAHAFAPIDGRLHLNEVMNWSIGIDPEAYDVESVVTHEIGHLLGLGHSLIREAIMFPSIGKGMTKQLAQDDIDGINSLYSSVN